MDRNNFLAIVLSCAVVLLWMAYQAQFAPPPAPPGMESETELAAPVAEKAAPPASAPPAEFERAPKAVSEPGRQEELLVFEKPLYVAELSSRGATLQKWELRGYHLGVADGSGPVVLTNEAVPVVPTLATPFPELGLGDLSEAIFEIENQDGDGVRFRYSSNGVTVRKTYTLDEDSYSFRLRIQVENASTGTVAPEFSVLWPAAKRTSHEFSTEAFALLHDGSIVRNPVAALGKPGFFKSLFGGGNEGNESFVGAIDWAGVETTYFLGALLPDNPARAKVTLVPGHDGDGVAAISFDEVTLPTGQMTVQEFRAYLGPKEVDTLEALGADTVRSVDLGYAWIEPLVLGFAWMLRALYSIIPNYGLAIILLTILVRLVTMPLTNRQMRSMERMRTLQPKIKELQAKHADDRQKQSEEMMKMYRTEGVNPLGGCFPMVLQLPVFIGLFYALRGSISLRQAPFVGWITDLSAPETLFTIPGIDIPVRVLPLVMGVSMVLQQKITPTASVDPAQARMMMTIMPIMMTVLFYQFPSGLVLYWFVSNVLAISNQLWIGRGMRKSGA